MQYVLLQRRSRWRSTSITSPVVVIETANPTIESVDHALAGLDHDQQRDRSTSQASRCATEQRKENS